MQIDGHLLLQSVKHILKQFLLFFGCYKTSENSLFKLPIIEYLDETRPNVTRLLPTDSLKRAQVRSISEIINSGIQPYQNANVVKRIVQYGVSEEKKAEWLSFYISQGLRAVESALRESSGKYCVGDEVSSADLCLVPQVYSAKRFNISLDEFPNVKRVNDELEKLPAFHKAHAHRQPDTPSELREN